MNRREMIALGAALSLTPWLRSEPPKDERAFKSIYESDFPLVVPKTLEAWKQRAERIREQILVATGLWPMPERPKIVAKIHGTIRRDGYVIEKVFFESRPGHTLTGNLYRGESQSLMPGVLFAHGHWEKGRFMEASPARIKTALGTKAEATTESAKYHMQAACATLARRGYVVFQYDMVGFADSTAIGHVSKSGVPHHNGFADLEGELHLISLMGLQTWNSLRALDYLASRPDVDPKRLGMTGGSGGGTQTFMTAALDDRITAAVPAVMVSTRMQGGCVCENCSLLRVGTGNVEFAALMAPRPQALTCADDWTKDFMTQGFPELQAIYKLHGKPENVQAKAWLEYPHNYNQPAREFMVRFFAKHFEGIEEAVKEPPFEPVAPSELSVFDATHPRPKNESNAAELRKSIRLESQRLIGGVPQDAERQAAHSMLIQRALRAMLGDEQPASIVVRAGPKESKIDGVTIHRAWFGRADEKDSLATLGMFGPKFDGSNALLWVHADGIESLVKDGKVVPAARRFLDAGYAVISGDLYAKPLTVNPVYAGFTFGYNRTRLAQRVHDILTLVGFATTMLKVKNLRLAGWGQAGPWAALAVAAAAKSIARSAVDLQHFDFAKLTDVNDEMMLPGALKYGGLPGLLVPAAPQPLAAFNAPADMALTVAAYAVGGRAAAFTYDLKPWPEAAVVEWLLK